MGAYFFFFFRAAFLPRLRAGFGVFLRVKHPLLSHPLRARVRIPPAQSVKVSQVSPKHLKAE